MAFDAARMVSQSNSGGYMISFDSFANLASSIETRANNCNILIPARYSSLKTLFTVMILQENIGKGAHTKKTITNRMNLSKTPGSGIARSEAKMYRQSPSKPTRRPLRNSARPYIHSAIRVTQFGSPGLPGSPPRGHTSSPPTWKVNRTSLS